MTNTKARHEEILSVAVEVLDAAGGVEAIDALSQDKRTPKLRKLAKMVVKETACHVSSAKKNIAKAMSRARYGIMQEQWGGKRTPVGGRPKLAKKEDKEKLEC